MSQTYTDDCYNASHQVATDMQAIEDNFAAIKSSFSGASSPSNPVAGMLWFDTTANILKLRNEANDAWQSVWDFANNKPIVANLSLEITTAMLAADLITNAKLADNAVQTENILDGAVTFAKCSFGAGAITPIAGTSLGIASGPTERTTTSTSYTKKKEATIIFAGTYTVSHSLAASPGTGEAFSKVYVDGVAYGSEHSLYHSTGPTTYSDIVTVTAGQKISVYIKSSSGSITAKINDFLVTCGNNPFMTSAVTD